MAELLERLTADMKTALKGGDKPRLQVVRMLICGIKDAALRAGKDDLDADGELDVLRKAVKSRRDTIAQAQQAGRADIADAEQREVEIISGYLPALMSPAELAAKVRELAAQIGYAGRKDTGRFMKEWMQRYKGAAEGRDVQTELGKLG
jgi:hypothetical protein